MLGEYPTQVSIMPSDHAEEDEGFLRQGEAVRCPCLRTPVIDDNPQDVTNIKKY